VVRGRTALRQGSYALLGADKVSGPFEFVVGDLRVGAQTRFVELSLTLRVFYKLEYVGPGINSIPAAS